MKNHSLFVRIVFGMCRIKSSHTTCVLSWYGYTSYMWHERREKATYSLKLCHDRLHQQPGHFSAQRVICWSQFHSRLGNIDSRMRTQAGLRSAKPRYHMQVQLLDMAHVDSAYVFTLTTIIIYWMKPCKYG